MQEQPPRVVIRANSDPTKVFPTVGVTLTQLVFWANDDTVAHQPAALDGSFTVPEPIQPGTTSNSQAPGNDPNIPALTQGQVYELAYACKLHPTQTGVLEIVNDFYALNEQLTITRDKNNNIPQTHLIVGGKPPYTHAITYSELPTTIICLDNGDLGPTLQGASPVAGTFLLSMTITDALNNISDNTFQITVI